jgi:Zn finger protein HypA/HybF involved in hydrogenase expression
MIKKLKCEDCRHEWIPRTENPVECPACKSRRWKKKKENSQSGFKK